MDIEGGYKIIAVKDLPAYSDYYEERRRFDNLECIIEPLTPSEVQGLLNVDEVHAYMYADRDNWIDDDEDA